MHHTEPSFAEIQHQRRESVAETIHPVSAGELERLLPLFFPDALHPWHEAFGKFIRQHQDEQAWQGETADGYGLIYYPKSARGIWFHLEEGVRAIGHLSERNLHALAEIVSEKS